MIMASKKSLNRRLFSGRRLSSGRSLPLRPSRGQRLVTIAVCTAMSAFLVSSTATAFVPAVATKLPRVIGGADSSFSVSRWQVVFIIKNETICSGSLVSARQIVSAAHCFDDVPKNQVQAWLGITDLSERSQRTKLSIGSIENHPDFNPETYANDIAIVKLSKPVLTNLNAATIGLPVKENKNTWPPAGTFGVISGWGETSPSSTSASDRLQSAVAEVLADPGDPTCGQYGSAYLPSLQICAGSLIGEVDACSGDSGGPLVFAGEGGPVLGGIVSTGRSCGEAGYPGLYTRVSTYLPWLKANGVDIENAGSSKFSVLPGSRRDGVAAVFVIGESYGVEAFAPFAKLPRENSRVTVTGGTACRQRGAKVKMVDIGTCSLTVTNKDKKVRLAVRIY